VKKRRPRWLPGRGSETFFFLFFISLAVLTPLILLADLFLFLGAEIVLDIEELADFFGALTLDDIGDRFAGNIKELVDIKIVGSKDELKDSIEVDFAELLIPRIDRFIQTSTIISQDWSRMSMMMSAIFDDLLHDL